jgi:alpha-beta hydrolase superfamily lysophospholipase
VVLALAATGVAVTAVARLRDEPNDVGDASIADHRATRATPAPTAATAASIVPTVTGTEPAPPTTTAVPPYPVDVVQTTVEDPTRPTAARGPTPAASSRTLPLTVYVPQAPGRFPLVVFAHGYDIAAADYGALLQGLAAQGFVVVAPDFPRSSSIFPGAPTQADIDEQARDVAFLVDAFVDDRVPGAWSGRVASGEAGVVGHSDGGNTVARAAGNSCCFAPRVGAAVVLAGDEGTSGGSWGVAGAAPMLIVQGTSDNINPWAFSQRLYDDAAPPKTLVAIDGGSHLAPYAAPPDPVLALVAAFLRSHLAADAATAAQLPLLAEAGDLRLVATT